ncbi:MAG: DUF305 domain-containing protein [Rhodoglobus sp.]
MKLRTIALISSALVSTLILAGCSAADPAPSPSSSSSEEASAVFNSADVMFASGMIPHHQQAIEMADVVLAKDGIDARVIELAQQIKAAQDPEITTMKGWLTEWGIEYDESAMEGMVGMEGMDHGDGLMSQSDMDALDRATGDDASRLFLEQMIVHHEGAIMMAELEIDNGNNPAAIELAEAIVSGQTTEVSTMNTLLGSL